MNHVVIEDGCHIQGSVICNNVQLQERAVLKDCQVPIFSLFVHQFYLNLEVIKTLEGKCFIHVKR